MKKLDYIDALRGFAILGVLMIHTAINGHNSNVPDVLMKLFIKGARGVQLFYLVSAFTLFLSFKSRSGKETSRVGNFFIRRFFRIAPMYYFVLCYYVFEEGVLIGYWGNATISNIIAHFTFMHGFNIAWVNTVVIGGWSIAVEIIFYAILPFLFSRIKNINQALIFFGISLLINYLFRKTFNTILGVGLNDEWSTYIFMLFPSQLPIFSLGIIMYFFIAEYPSISKLSAKLLLAICGILLILLGTGYTFMLPAFILFGVSLVYFFKQITNRLPIYILTITAVSILLITFCAYRFEVPTNIAWHYTDELSTMLPDHVVFGIVFLFSGIALSSYPVKLLVNPVINYIGKISYSMYLVHFAVLYWLIHFKFIDYVDNGILNYIIRFSVISVFTILLSSLTYKIIELPFQKWGKKIINKREEAKTGVASQRAI